MRVFMTLLLSLAVVLPTAAAVQPGTTTPLTTRARELVSMLRAGKFQQAAATFDQNMKRQLGPDKLATVWKQLTDQTGDLKTIGAAHEIEAGAYRVVFVRCTFSITKLDAKVVYDDQGRVAGLFFVAPQPVAAVVGEEPPAGITEEEVTVGAAPWRLPGTLTMPQGKGPFPAVVLVAGSGPQDRDETIGPNKVFRDLAWGLAARQIAVLRYEKRSKRYPAEMQKIHRLTLDDEVIADARAAVALLGRHAKIDRHHIYVLGHSLGGTAAPRIAAGDPAVAGLIILAGATTPLEENMVRQLRYIAGLDGTVSPEEKERIAQAEAAARTIRDPKLSPDATVTVLGASTPGSYWLDLRSYDPAATAAGLKLPILILQGGRDYQVTTDDLKGWKKALSGKPNVSFKTYPKLNHLFMTGEGPSSPAEYAKPGHVAPQVIADIAAWIGQHTAPAP